MPTYVYKFIDTGETIEVQQSFTDETLSEAVHPATGEKMAVKKVFQPVGVTFKGDGFYKTDSRSSGSSKPSKPTESTESTGSTSSESGSGSPATSESSAASSDSGSSSSGSSGD